MFGRKQRRTDTRDSQSERTQSRGASRRGRRRGASEQTLSNQQLQQRLKERGIQPKLTVNEPDDEYEKEAERVAEAVMQMPDPIATVDLQEGSSPEQIQQMCSRCQRPYRQGKPLNCEECEEELRRKEGSEEAPWGNGRLKEQIQSLRGGRPLPRSVRSFFEPRFEKDFRDVRIHTSTRADEAAQSASATAFTKGREIVFRSGAYRPRTRSGKRLLAHELTHVVQQGEVGDLGLQRWQYGRGTHNSGARIYHEIPQDEREGSNGTDAAMAIVDRLATGNDDRAEHCQNWFDNNCDINRSLQDINARARIWKFSERPHESLDGVTDASNRRHHAVEQDLIDMRSKWAVAGNVIHEYWHDCETRAADIGDQAITACGLPDA